MTKTVKKHVEKAWAAKVGSEVIHIDLSHSSMLKWVGYFNRERTDIVPHAFIVVGEFREL